MKAYAKFLGKVGIMRLNGVCMTIVLSSILLRLIWDTHGMGTGLIIEWSAIAIQFFSLHVMHKYPHIVVR